jgi:pyridoxamine 5'-phosphate oxidase family protein
MDPTRPADDAVGERPPFSAGEAAYLQSQSLGRLASLDSRGAPTVVPVGYRLGSDDAGAIVITIVGFRLIESAKFRNLARDGRYAFVVDDGIGPSARGVLVRGRATPVDDPQRPSILLHPERVTSWGVDTPPFERQHRRVG